MMFTWTSRVYMKQFPEKKSDHHLFDCLFVYQQDDVKAICTKCGGEKDQEPLNLHVDPVLVPHPGTFLWCQIRLSSAAVTLKNNKLPFSTVHQYEDL